MTTLDEHLTEKQHETIRACLQFTYSNLKRQRSLLDDSDSLKIQQLESQIAEITDTIYAVKRSNIS